MAEWIDIPAQRLLRITREEAYRDFTYYDQDGGIHEPGNGKRTYRVRRNKDGRMFEPSPLLLDDADVCAVAYLREV